MNKINWKYTLLVLIIVILVLALYLIKPNRQVSVDITADYPNKHQMLYEFRAQNTTPRIVENAEVRAYLSSDKANTQIIKNITSTTEHSLFTDGVGSTFSLFKFKNVAAGGGEKITIQADLGHNNKTDRATKEFATTYLQEEPILKIAEEELNTILEVIKEKNTGNAISDILAWMMDDYPQKIKSFESQKTEKPSRSFNNIENLKGRPALSLGDVYLFVALSRASEIPARVIVGARITGQSNNEYVDTKLLIWPEVFNENAWHIVDINKFSVSESNADYIALRTMDRVMPPLNGPIEAYLFDTMSIKIVPGSVKLRIKSIEKL